MKNHNQTFLAYGGFWLIAFAIYFKTAGAGFVTDEIGWLQTYEEMGWHGIFNAFGDKSLHYVYHLTAFLIWKIFGLNGFVWMVIFVSMHASISVLSFRIFEILFSKLGITSSSIIAFAGGILFLVSPYQTEPLVWYACIHYLVCSFLLLVAFRFLLFYLEQPDVKFVTAFYLCFMVSLFTLEISFAFPVILFVFFLFWHPKVFNDKNRSQLIKIFVAPSFVLLAFYFLLSKFLRGSAVGHYGTEEHLNFSVPLLMSNLSKYVSKIFFLTQFLAVEARQHIYAVFENEKFVWSLFFVMALGVSGFLFFFRKLKPVMLTAILLFAFFVIAILPILNLFFSSIVNVEGDRFTYFASVFACQFIAFSCITLFRKWGWILLAMFFYFNVKFLQFNTHSWNSSGTIQQSLLNEFKWQDAGKIFLLNIPDNFRGCYMFRSSPPDVFFAKSLLFKTRKSIEGKTTEILEYNMNSLTDSVIVEKISENELKVTFAQWGNWWWSKGIGAGDYSTRDYDVKIDEWSHSYLLSFKNKPVDAVYLYQCGGHWREVKDF